MKKEMTSSAFGNRPMNTRDSKGVVHGGIQAALLDEIGGWTIMVKLGTSGVTSRMELKYRKPVKTSNEPVKLSCHVLSFQGRIAVMHASISDAKSMLCTEAFIEYYIFPEERARKELNYPGKASFYNGIV